MQKLDLKSSLIYITIFIVALALGVCLGKYTLEPQVEIQVQEKVVIKEKIDIQYQDRIVYRNVFNQDISQKVKVTETEKLYPDGKTEKVKVSEFDTSQKTEAVTTSEQNSSSTLTKDLSSTQEKTSTTKKPPDWNISVLVGATKDPWPLPPPYVAGIHVQRRVLGPIYIGAWGLTNASAGVSIGVEF